MPSLDTKSLIERALALKAEHPGWGYRIIAKEIGWDRHHVRRAIEHAQRRQAPVPQHQGQLDFYESACQALTQAKTVDAAKDGLDRAEAIRIYARRAKNHQLEADAWELRELYERRLGTLIASAKAVGQISRGKPPDKCSPDEQYPRVKLDDYGIDRKLSMRSQKKAEIPEPQFRDLIANQRSEIIAGHRVPDVLKDVTTKGKQERRATRERVLGGIQCALPQVKFGVIVADPEWRFEPWSRVTGMDRSADNHYPTSVTEVIAARDVPSIAADECVLFLWATIPMLPHALTVMAAWGFDYKSHYVWAKDKAGTGFWNREIHELWLIGTRGNVPAPAMGTQFPSVIDAPRLKHSEKPVCFLEIIEGWFPTLPKIELNRRGPERTGWAAWGNEATTSEAAEFYNAQDDFAKSRDVGFAAIRERMAAGGPGWELK